MRLWICEKRDQAQNIAPLLGNPKPGQGYIDTDDGRVTWARGHLLEQVGPPGYDKAWEAWNFDVLPMIPSVWKHQPTPDKERELAVLLANIPKATEIIIATDCGAEGEAIARELLDHAGYRGAVRRLWYSALDAASLTKAIASLRPGESSEPLYWASQARSRADWLMGMNLSRAYTLRSRAAGGKGPRHVGRVMSPTLALVVRRDAEIAAFREVTYYELEITAQTALGASVVLTHAPADAGRIFARADAEAILAAATGASGPLAVTHESKAQKPPALMTLSRFQQLASRRFGWSAKKTLDIAQSLYDKELTSYPRTPCMVLPNEQEAEIPRVLETLGQVPGLARHVAALTVHKPTIRPTVFNSAKMAKDNAEHHAIVPTGVPLASRTLSDDEQTAFLLIAQHYLAALMPDYTFNETRMTLEAGGVPFTVTGRVPIAQGWKSVFGTDPDSEDEDDTATPALPDIQDGTRCTVAAAALRPKKTRPPKRYTEGDLIADMLDVGKFATNPEVRKRLKENAGIGTEATRGTIIENLRERGYLEPQGKFIVSTPLARELIAMLPAPITDAATTALWEEKLDELRRGLVPVEARDEFVNKVAANVTRIINAVRDDAAKAAATRAPSEGQLRYAQAIAVALGVPLPANADSSHTAVQAFLDAHGDAYGNLPPSDKQLAYAEKLATEKGATLSDEQRRSRAALGAWLDLHADKKAAPAKKVTGKTTAAKTTRKRKVKV
ncbi:DNA topoisomerase III [Xanthomonas perforans]|uniref:DNA topoisomerase n=2 Tax=Xanthomonas TaxID=338 RepID=A0A6P0FLP9_XANPE|nr:MULTISPECIES: DNA topoisomerase III [Xanthomonas]APO89003.1 DNA topoisomerase III [Xanthomonas euvesicatoria]KLB41211.1 DNA topoisomerase III [Xanthomonas euvesicatoria]KLC01670.1 DNA topoisomerase III [Xanthomonas perforans]KLC11474.1 DNA topoisomerase III [Xanthomonas perforans]KLC15849.1 DNA topoisomerase III [Xanthomonas perforans]